MRQVIAGIEREELLPKDELFSVQELTLLTRMNEGEAENAGKALGCLGVGREVLGGQGKKMSPLLVLLAEKSKGVFCLCSLLKPNRVG